MFYVSRGNVPHKRHTQHRAPDGSLYAEELFGMEGFTGRSLVALSPRSAHPDAQDRTGPGPDRSRPLTTACIATDWSRPVPSRLAATSSMRASLCSSTAMC